MLGFIDESGDPGIKVGQGSSRYFVTAMVTFEDASEALRCDQRISSLRAESRLPGTYEFHFSKNSMKHRESFLRAVEPFAFGYHAIVLDKDPVKLRDAGIGSTNLYNYVTGPLFATADEHLSNLTVVMDQRGSRKFRSEISVYLRTLLRAGGRESFIRQLNVQDSRRNNLLQLADYVAGVLKRTYEGDSLALGLQERYLSHKQIRVEHWPK